MKKINILTKQGTRYNLLFRKNPNWQQVEINRILDENIITDKSKNDLSDYEY